MARGRLSREKGSLEEAKAALRRAEQAVEKAQQRERQIRDAERRRLSELAHEIKTPLNAMLGYTFLLAEQMLGPHSDPKYAEYARTVYEASLHLQDICDGVMSEQGGGGPAVELSKVKVGDLASRVVTLFAGMAEERGIDLKADVPDSFPDLRTDARRLNQIVVNLVSNAIKFTPRGGRVSIQAEFDESSGAMIFVVADTGKGMDAARLKNVVKPFRKGRGESPHGDPGAGIGLSICDRLTKQLRGELRLSSEENVGTVASVCLPLTYDAADFIDPSVYAKVFDKKPASSFLMLHQRNVG